MIPTRVAACLALLASLAACASPPPSAQSRANQATLAACRSRADDVFQRQNRAALFTQDNRDEPESGSYNSGITTRGLAEQYTYGSEVSDCVRNQGSTSQPEAGPANANSALEPRGPGAQSNPVLP